MVVSGLRKAITAGAVSGLVRAAFSRSRRGSLGLRAKRRIQSGMRRAVAYIVAGIIFLVAMGFLIAAFYIWLAGLLGAPLAALLTAVVLILAGVLTIIFGRHDSAEADEALAEEEETGLAEEQQDHTGERPTLDTAIFLLRDLMKVASENMGAILAAVILIGFWFGWGPSKADEETSPENDDTDAPAPAPTARSTPADPQRAAAAPAATASEPLS